MTTEKAQELTASITASIEQLCKETDAAKQSAIYRDWLSTMSRFYRYSFGNQILIWTQKAVTYCYTSLESTLMRVCALRYARDGRDPAVLAN